MIKILDHRLQDILILGKSRSPLILDLEHEGLKEESLRDPPPVLANFKVDLLFSGLADSLSRGCK